MKVINVVEEFYYFKNYSSNFNLLGDNHTELDESKILNEEDIGIYQSYMRILQRCVEIGRIDMKFATYNMAKYLSLPREQNLISLGQMFDYIDKNQCSRIVFDTI